MAKFNQLNLSLCHERILYDAIYRHVLHLACIEECKTDSILAAQIAVQLIPEMGYPVPSWITDLAQYKD